MLGHILTVNNVLADTRLVCGLGDAFSCRAIPLMCQIVLFYSGISGTAKLLFFFYFWMMPSSSVAEVQ